MTPQRSWGPGALLAVAAALLLVGCQPRSPDTVPSDFEVTLERGPCFGTCPVYSMTVSSDGSVVYNGMDFVIEEGRQEASVSTDQVTEIFQAVIAADFFDLEDRYEVGATDLPSITTSVTMNGQTQAIYHYGLGCGTELDLAPRGLCQLEALLEAIPASQGWVSFE
jgi:hypothetical protein